jgi:hypothetical protein
VRFASPEWVGAFVRALSAQPGLAAALEGLTGDLAVVVEPGPGQATPVLAWGRHAGGRITEWRMLEDEDELVVLEPHWVLRAPLGTWRELIEGADPVKAALTGRVRVEGDLPALVRRAHHRGVVDAALASVPTEFPEAGR